MSSVKRLALVGTIALCATALAAAEGTTIPKGTSVELTLQDSLSTRTAKVGDTFRATVVPAIDIDDQPVLPEGTVVVGKVELVKSIRHGHLTGVIGVKFTDVQLPGAQEQGIEGVLTSWRQDDRKRLVELAPLGAQGGRSTRSSSVGARPDAPAPSWVTIWRRVIPTRAWAQRKRRSLPGRRSPWSLPSR